MSRPMLQIEGLSKAFRSDAGGVSGVVDVSLSVSAGEFFSILGPSGCGKSTLLRLIAGLEQPNTGRILIDGQPVFDAALGIDMPPGRRGLGMVFQTFAVWPHMRVRDNVTFPLQAMPRGQRPDRATQRRLADEALAMVELVALADRPAGQLSGGQKQRLALARAIVARPRLILLDEPLSNLDARLRQQLRRTLRDLQAELDLTFLYVTHDQTEALSNSHRIAVMKQGQIQQVGPPRQVYHAPKTAFVARFMGASETLRRDGGGLVRPENLQFAQRSSGEDWIAVRIIAREFHGAFDLLEVDSPMGKLHVPIAGDSKVRVGDAGFVRLIGDGVLLTD